MWRVGVLACTLARTIPWQWHYHSSEPHSSRSSSNGIGTANRCWPNLPLMRLVPHSYVFMGAASWQAGWHCSSLWENHHWDSTCLVGCTRDKCSIRQVAVCRRRFSFASWVGRWRGQQAGRMVVRRVVIHRMWKARRAGFYPMAFTGQLD